LPLTLFLVFFLGLTLRAGNAEAHAVYIFAYANGDQICTDSYFSKKSRVIAGEVTMSDASGKVLEKGTTANDGSYCFKAPPGEGDLSFVVLAGEGHRGEFTLRAADRPTFAGDLTETNASSGTEGDASSVSVSGSSSGINPAPAASAAGGEAYGLSQNSLRAIIREELMSQLGPINRELAQSRDDQTPTLREIVGGLGWVAGVTGLIFWLRGRRPVKPKP
jgi:nickel transport protein